MINSFCRHKLLYLLSLIIIGLTASLIIAGSLIARNQQLSLTATVEAIGTMNSRVIVGMDLCEEISSLTGSASPCEGHLIDAWSATPSPLPPGFPTFTDVQLTATQDAHQQYVPLRLSIICPSWAAVQLKSHYCQ